MKEVNPQNILKENNLFLNISMSNIGFLIFPSTLTNINNNIIDIIKVPIIIGLANPILCPKFIEQKSNIIETINKLVPLESKGILFSTFLKFNVFNTKI